MYMKFLKDIRPIGEILKDSPKEVYEDVKYTVQVLMAVSWIAGFFIAFVIVEILL